VHDHGPANVRVQDRKENHVRLSGISSPFETPEEIDERAESKSGGRSRRSLPKPLRIFPKLFPVPTTIYGIVTIIAAMLIVVALFSSVREVLSPILLAVVAGVLLFPFRREPKIRPVLAAAALVFLVWFISVTMHVLFPFVLAFIFAYIADPVVSYVQRKWYVGRWISALVITLLSVAAVVVGIGFVVPVLIEQVGTAYASIDKVIASTLEWARSGALTDLTGIPQQKINQMLATYVMPRLRSLDGSILSLAGSAGRAAPGIFSTLINLVMVPFVMFYFIKDYWRIRIAIYSFMPREYQRKSQRFLHDLDEVAGGFLRGDLITSIFQGTFIGIGLSLIGVPGALLLGVLMGFLSLIPLIGGYISFAISAIAALGAPDPGLKVLYVGLLYIGQAIIESTIISPQVMGRHTNLHPLIVIFSIFVFGYFMGVVGMLIAIPVTALVVRSIVRRRDDRQAKLEQEKVLADLERNPHHASRNDKARMASREVGLKGAH
jgi:predicted PurR-regulated permease PerM